MDVKGKTVAIVGAGLIGRAWAMVFARAGWSVRVTDSAPSQLAAARELIALSLAEQEQAGLADDAKAALARIEISASLGDAVTGAAWVQENLPEDVEIKRAVFAELDRLAPASAILASSTSAIVASHFTRELAGRARCLNQPNQRGLRLWGQRHRLGRGLEPLGDFPPVRAGTRNRGPGVRVARPPCQ